MIGGHSDVTLGVVCGSDDIAARDEPGRSASGAWRPTRSTAGWRSAGWRRWRCACGRPRPTPPPWPTGWPSSPAWSASSIPGRRDHPDHDLAGRAAPRAASATCSASSWPAAARPSTAFMRRARAFPSARRWATRRRRAAIRRRRRTATSAPAEKQRQGITDGLIRLSVGVEDLAEIQ